MCCLAACGGGESQDGTADASSTSRNVDVGSSNVDDSSSHGDGDNEYRVTVTASDGKLSDSRAVSVLIADDAHVRTRTSPNAE